MIDLLVDLVKRHLAALADNIWDSVFFWRSLSITALIVIVGAWAQRRRIAQWVLGSRARELATREHDTLIFRKMDAALSEGAIHDILNQQIYSLSCTRDDILAVAKFCEDFSRTENEYLDGTLKEVAGALVPNLRAVERFVATHSLPVQTSDGAAASQFYPDDPVGQLARRIDEVKHEAFIKELNPLIDRAWKSYQHFRRTVKNRLQL